MTVQWNWKWRSGGEWESACSATIPNGRILSKSHRQTKAYTVANQVYFQSEATHEPFSNPYR